MAQIASLLQTSATATDVRETSWAGWLARWAAGRYDAGLAPFRNAIEDRPERYNMESAGPCMVCISRPGEDRFLYLSENAERVLGLPHSMIRQGRTALLQKHILREDYLDLIWAGRQFGETYESLPLESRPGFIRRFVLRMKDMRGGVRTLLDQSLVLQTDAQGTPSLLLAALSRVDEGEISLKTEFRHQLAKWRPKPILIDFGRLVCGLTEKEKRILSHYAEGQSPHELAEALGLGTDTLVGLCRNLLAKSGHRQFYTLLNDLKVA